MPRASNACLNAAAAKIAGSSIAMFACNPFAPTVPQARTSIEPGIRSNPGCGVSPLAAKVMLLSTE